MMLSNRLHIQKRLPCPRPVLYPRASWKNSLARLAEGVTLRSASSQGTWVMVVAAAEGRFFFSS